MDRTLYVGLAGYRWAAWLWMALVAVLARGRIIHPAPAIGLISVALAITLVWTVVVQRRQTPQPILIGAEIATGLGLQLADGWVYEAGHVFSSQQPLGVAWPMAMVLTTGVAYGPVGGGAIGASVGLARALSSVANAGEALEPTQLMSLVTTTFLYTLAGAATGLVTRLLRDADTRVSQAKAREEIARTLHDGVLQTLALVERRAGDPALAKMAREQERELRAFLFGGDQTPVIGAGDLGDALRAAAGRFEDRYEVRADVLVPDDLPTLGDAEVNALVGAVGEALANVGKHAAAKRVTIYLEPDDSGGVYCSVRDDGTGFDATAMSPGFGIANSINGRIQEVGGTAEVASAVGRGTEVAIRVGG